MSRSRSRSNPRHELTASDFDPGDSLVPVIKIYIQGTAHLGVRIGQGNNLQLGHVCDTFEFEGNPSRFKLRATQFDHMYVGACGGVGNENTIKLHDCSRGQFGPNMFWKMLGEFNDCRIVSCENEALHIGACGGCRPDHVLKLHDQARWGVTENMVFTLIDLGSPPGFQRDGAGHHYCAVARTKWGNIPGKAKGNTCWFSHDGKEHTTDKFEIIRVNTEHRSVRGSPQGFQNDGSGELWCAIAETGFGKIPGKAKNGTCWFPYGGKEHVTTNFKYVGFDEIIEKQQGRRCTNNRLPSCKGEEDNLK